MRSIEGRIRKIQEWKKVIYGGGRSSCVRSDRLGNTTLRLACIVVFNSSSSMYLCAKWLRKLFPQTVLDLTFNLRQTSPSTVSGKKKKVDDA